MKKTSQRALMNPATLPILPDINEEIFDRAGITKDDRAQLLSKLFRKTVKRLDATHIKVFGFQGATYHSKPLVDHTTQGKAVDQAMQLVGLQKQDAPKVTVKAVIKLPEWGTRKIKTIQDTPVIESMIVLPKSTT